MQYVYSIMNVIKILLLTICHSLQLNIIFITKTSLFCAGIPMPCIEVPYAYWQKVLFYFSCTLFHKLCDFTIKLVSMDSRQPLKMCIRKFCMRYSLINNFDQILLELYQKVSDGDLLFWPSVLYWLMNRRQLALKSLMTKGLNCKVLTPPSSQRYIYIAFNTQISTDATCIQYMYWEHCGVVVRVLDL